jgi:hypothetical protein
MEKVYFYKTWHRIENFIRDLALLMLRLVPNSSSDKHTRTHFGLWPDFYLFSLLYCRAFAINSNTFTVTVLSTSTECYNDKFRKIIKAVFMPTLYQN